MRDPARIPVMLEVLRKLWEKSPDLRLGQILVIATHVKSPCPEVFYIEDDKLLIGLQEFLETSNYHHVEKTVPFSERFPNLDLE